MTKDKDLRVYRGSGNVFQDLELENADELYAKCEQQIQQFKDYKKVIVAIDPGTTQSAIVVWDGSNILYKNILDNEKVLSTISFASSLGVEPDILVVEMIASYGMAVGAEVFNTCVWIGRFIQQWRVATFKEYRLVYRQEVKKHICSNTSAKDSNIRQALIDRFGSPGSKKDKNINPITYGLSKDLWAAFAVAVFYYDTSDK